MNYSFMDSLISLNGRRFSPMSILRQAQLKKESLVRDNASDSHSELVEE